MNAPPSDRLGLSLLQHVPTPGDIDAALARLETAANEAAANGSALLITPECGMTGYDMNEADCEIASFTAEGKVAQHIGDIARTNNLAILYGFMENDNGNRYNTAQLVDAEGKVLLRYRKTHLWGDLDRNLFRAGQQLAPVVNLNGWNVGVLICYDVEFPETVRTLVLEGADLILVPTALMHPWRFVAERLVPVRALENQVFLAYANLVGAERNTFYEGRSCIIAPDGSELARAADEDHALLHASLSAAALDEIREKLPYLRDRRPELYTPICASTNKGHSRS